MSSSGSEMNDPLFLNYLCQWHNNQLRMRIWVKMWSFLQFPSCDTNFINWKISSKLWMKILQHYHDCRYCWVLGSCQSSKNIIESITSIFGTIAFVARQGRQQAKSSHHISQYQWGKLFNRMSCSFHIQSYQESHGKYFFILCV